MIACCQGPECGTATAATPLYRRALWIALVVNAIMFVVELVGGLEAGSSALQADSLDFLGDAANYGLSLFVLASAMSIRARASVLKAATMGAFGIWVIAHAVYVAASGRVPEPMVMTVIGLIALTTNVCVALLLYRYRTGDSNMRSVWICSRNDAISNSAVVAAAAGVFTTRQGWPDIAVAMIMGVLSLSGAAQVLRHAQQELSAMRTAGAR